MSTEEKDVKTARATIFNGKREAFQTQWIRFRAYAKIARFLKVINDTPEPDLPSNQTAANALTGTDESAKRRKAATARNDSAILNLTLAFETNKMIAII